MKNTINKVILTALVIITAVGGAFTPTPALAFGPSIFSRLSSIFSMNIANTIVDDRAARLDAYFAKRDMPLEGYGAKFIEVADAYDMDWRLMPAIGVRESSGGKHLMNNNPFGWGSAKIKFANFDAAIEELGANISGNDKDTARYYKDKTVFQVLWAYNGTVMPTYPKEVMNIMKMF